MAFPPIATATDRGVVCGYETDGRFPHQRPVGTLFHVGAQFAPAPRLREQQARKTVASEPTHSFSKSIRRAGVAGDFARPTQSQNERYYDNFQCKSPARSTLKNQADRSASTRSVLLDQERSAQERKTYEYAEKCEVERTQPQLLDAPAQVLSGKKSVAADGLGAIALSVGEPVAALGEQQPTSRAGAVNCSSPLLQCVSGVSHAHLNSISTIYEAEPVSRRDSTSAAHTRCHSPNGA